MTVWCVAHSHRLSLYIIMSWIAPKQNAFKFAPHKQKSIVKKMAGIFSPPRQHLSTMVNTALCVYDCEHGMDICISQLMKLKMNQSRHNNLFFQCYNTACSRHQSDIIFKIKRFSLAFGFLAELYFIVLYILQQVVNCWLDTATLKEQWKQHVRINNNLLYSTCF